MPRSPLHSVPVGEDRSGEAAPGSPAAAQAPLRRFEIRLLLLMSIVGALLCLARVQTGLHLDRMVVVWVLLCFGGEVLWFRTPTYDGTLSLALTLDIAAIACLPAGPAVVVIGLSTLLAGMYPHRRPWYRVLFNVAQCTVAATAASAVYSVVSHAGGVAESRHVPVLALASAGIVFYGLNTFLVALAQALSHDRSPFEVWRESYAYPLELASTGGQLTLALFVVLAYQVVGPASLLAVFPVLVALWLGARGHSDVAPPPPSIHLAR